MQNKSATSSSCPTLSIAPMMKHTDRHYRYFMRGISAHTLLYTEMICATTILRGEYERYLTFNPEEHPVSLQLAGDDPAMLYDAVQTASAYNYDEYNLNAGCPSKRVKHGNFGASLMAKPKTVAAIVKAMKQADKKPVTVKHRLGIDGMKDYHQLQRFVQTVCEEGCDRFIVHARVALLSGLNPKQNRSIPPLQYDYVYRLQQDFPELTIEINGGIHTLEEAKEHLRHCRGVMIGRAAYHRPFTLAKADQYFFRQNDVPPSRPELVRRMIPYLEQQEAQGVSRRYILRHLMPLFSACPGASRWRALVHACPSNKELLTCAEALS